MGRDSGIKVNSDISVIQEMVGSLDSKMHVISELCEMINGGRT